MNKELQYVGQGVLLLVVVLAGMKTVQVLGSIEVADKTSNREFVCGTESLLQREGKLDESATKGKALFQENCASCHKVDKDLTGPALSGVEERVKNKKLLYAWIRNNAAVLKTGDPYFTKLFKDWQQTPMSSFPGLTDDEIEQILAYTRQYTLTPLPTPAAP